MKILCIEDGSVDIDKLEKDGLKYGFYVVLYRQGSRPPYVVDMGDNKNEAVDMLLDKIAKLEKKLLD